MIPQQILLFLLCPQRLVLQYSCSILVATLTLPPQWLINYHCHSNSLQTSSGTSQANNIEIFNTFNLIKSYQPTQIETINCNIISSKSKSISHNPEITTSTNISYNISSNIRRGGSNIITPPTSSSHHNINTSSSPGNVNTMPTVTSNLIHPHQDIVTELENLSSSYLTTSSEALPVDAVSSPGNLSDDNNLLDDRPYVHDTPYSPIAIGDLWVVIISIVLWIISITPLWFLETTPSDIISNNQIIHIFESSGDENSLSPNCSVRAQTSLSPKFINGVFLHLK